MKIVSQAVFLAIGLFVGYQAHDFQPLEQIFEKQVMEPRDVTLSCLSDAAVQNIRKSGSIDVAFGICGKELKNLLGTEFSHLDDKALRAIFATIAAAQYAEYGASSATSYAAIAASPTLNCGNTVILVGFLFGLNEPTLKPIGFDGGAVGNHAQLYYDAKNTAGDSIRLVLDPTTGLVVKTSFDDLLAGKPVSADRIKSFSIEAKSIESFREKVFQSVAKGSYRPSDFMYMHASVHEMLTKGSSDNYFTPGGIVVRDRLGNRPIGAKYGE